MSHEDLGEPTVARVAARGETGSCGAVDAWDNPRVTTKPPSLALSNLRGEYERRREAALAAAESEDGRSALVGNGRVLLVPYLAWCLFATALNWQFLAANPDADGAEVSGAAATVDFN